jgi:hypothetical protein
MAECKVSPAEAELADVRGAETAWDRHEAHARVVAIVTSECGAREKATDEEAEELERQVRGALPEGSGMCMDMQLEELQGQVFTVWRISAGVKRPLRVERWRAIAEEVAAVFGLRVWNAYPLNLRREKFGLSAWKELSPFASGNGVSVRGSLDEVCGALGVARSVLGPGEGRADGEGGTIR